MAAADMTPLKFDFVPGTVAESFVLAVVGSWVSLTIVHRSLANYLRGKDKDGASMRQSFLPASVALGGCGVWAMHFVGMQALVIEGTEMFFDIPLTLVSLFAVVVLLYASFFVTSMDPQLKKVEQQQPEPEKLTTANADGDRKSLSFIPALTVALTSASRYNICGGIICGMGVCVMHFVGMSAMILPSATTKWQPYMIVVSCLIAVTVSTVAMLLIFFLRHRSRLIPAVVMGLAVCTMHYTGMYAITYYESATEDPVPKVAIRHDEVQIIITAVLVLVLAITQLESVQSILVRSLMDEISKKEEDVKEANKRTQLAKVHHQLLLKYLKMINFGRAMNRPYTKLLLMELDRTIGPSVLAAGATLSPAAPSGSQANLADESTARSKSKLPVLTQGEDAPAPASVRNLNVKGSTQGDTSVRNLTEPTSPIDGPSNPATPIVRKNKINFSAEQMKDSHPDDDDEESEEKREDSEDEDTQRLARSLLEHPVTVEYCKDVATKMVSPELVFFYLDANFCHSLQRGSKASSNLARLIQQTYLEPGAKSEINISSNMRAQIIKDIAAKKPEPFKAAIHEVLKLLSEGTFKQWAHTDPASYNFCRKLVRLSADVGGLNQETLEGSKAISQVTQSAAVTSRSKTYLEVSNINGSKSEALQVVQSTISDNTGMGMRVPSGNNLAASAVEGSPEAPGRNVDFIEEEEPHETDAHNREPADQLDAIA